MNTSLSLPALGIMLLAATATGQDPAPYQPGPPIQSPPISYHHASTYEEGVLRGAADFTRASGEFNYNTTLALINREEAIRRRIYNHKYYAQTYFDMRLINRAGREALRRPRSTGEEIARRTKSGLPARLTVAELDPKSGKITWPSVWRGAEFASEREAIGQVMAATTARNGRLTSSWSRKVSEQIASMESKLQRVCQQMTSADRIAARRFLASLKYEARLRSHS